MKRYELITSHRINQGDSRLLRNVDRDSVDLVITSPPYPMIEMWDETFEMLNPQLNPNLIASSPEKSYDLMHDELNKVWEEMFRVLKPGRIACINIGDATRTTNEKFKLYTNHARITEAMQATGFHSLPNIIWKKPTNAPNKFMGSGMLPVGAYVTLEHEFILIFRKGEKQRFRKSEEKKARQRSAYFWEERNTWFSDIWDLKGTRQKMTGVSRKRSAAYPIEIPYRLINMFSMAGETVLDPFNGTGTTTRAAIENGRNSIGFEINESLVASQKQQLLGTPISEFQERQKSRINAHRNFIESKGEGYFKHFNTHHGFKVKTRQEMELVILCAKRMEDQNGILHVTHE